ncbi:class I SAM-dependent methyltransferase [Stenotrophomonas sp. HITSZ_GD]|uniref:class I SAM-dependent methyltransferase n=1 Tax=Stenotrophomonas sp. HITSZ_GD TaxID=3037248 RepID=UPI00240D6B6C|nr:class I SAM-dependent methyltransferase [Stenotrophomonas sp. HITSZ_GD]MDG2526685.1 class I SAM-dependent methyltransferase [Stenotrophomonas sp. HITSZ_GD]
MDLSSQARFSNRVADYVRYRPGYPPQLMAWIHDGLGVAPRARVADIGAGTGISSRMFLQAGHPVIAVEPNAAMRTAAEQWLGGEAGFAALDGSAEATGLADASVDMVSAAQAFHWFDTRAVRAEWARILRPGGLALVYWNSRLLQATPFLAGYEALLLEYGTDYRAVAERYQDDDTMRAWFGAGFVDAARFPNVQRMDFDALRGRLLSSSYAPAEGHPRHAPMLDALRALFDRHAVDGHVEFAYQTRAFAGTLD